MYLRNLQHKVYKQNKFKKPQEFCTHKKILSINVISAKQFLKAKEP